MNIEELQQLLRCREPESLKLEFKRKLYDIEHHDPQVRDLQWGEFIKDILALVNGNIGTAQKPGYLIIGVTDELNEQGTRDIHDVGSVSLTAQRILRKVNSACNPPLPDLRCEESHLEDKRILIITIPPTPYLHETTRAIKTPRATYPESVVFIRRKEDIGLASALERESILAEKRATFAQTEAPDMLKTSKPGLASDSVQRHRGGLATKPRYARWADQSIDESYISSVGFRLPLFASPYDDTSGISEDLSECIRAYQRLLILGEPGMGKTVALERAMWEFAVGTDVIIPIFVPLIHYDGSLADIIIAALNETGELNIASTTEMEQVIADYRSVFLFDGLNEAPGNYRDKLFAELASFLQAHPLSPCIITSRSQDELWRRFHSREIVEDAMVVRRIADDQIAEYLAAHLGREKGIELHDRLNDALRGLARVPLFLWLIKEAGLAGEELPGNRGQLFDRFVKQALKREQKQPGVTTIPVYQKIEALSHLAFSLYQDHRLTCNRGDAIRIIAEAESELDGTLLIDESLRNGILIGEAQIHYMHQAVQEYFAAVKAQRIISPLWAPGEITAQRMGRKKFSAIAIKRTLRRWAKEDWWAEVIVQLAGIAEKPGFVAEQVLRSSPWLAYWCSIEGQPLGDDLQTHIEQQTVAKLDSTKDEDRLRIVGELARMENPRTIYYLTTALSDLAIPVRELASQTLARLGEPSVDPLLEYLTFADEVGQRVATRTLGMIWGFPLVADLGSEDAQTRCLAAEALGTVGDDRAVLPLIAALEDPQEGVRQRAIHSLGQLGDSRAVDPLMEVLQQSYALARPYESTTIAQALNALGSPTDKPLLAGLRDSDHKIRQRALIALGRTWNLPAVAKLADNDPGTRREAIRELADSSDMRAIDPLLAALKDEDQSVRWEAVKVLGHKWQTPLITDLGSEDSTTRCQAVSALLGRSDMTSIELLIMMLQDKDHDVREYAVDALGTLGKVAIAPLFSLLNHKDREFRRNVCKALSMVDDDEVVDLLAAAMQDRRWIVREAASDTLAKLGDRSIPALEAYLWDVDTEVRNLALTTLRRIGTIRAQAAIRYASKRYGSGLHDPELQ
jgi:HEAT repeat protein